jgi:SAM-dependent methyltransferase
MTQASRTELLKIAHDRLHPSLTDPNFLVLRSRRRIFQSWISSLKGTSLTILDVGGRYQPYRPLFESREIRYYACDILRTELVDVTASGESLPFADESFDVVISTQVFEYFAHPWRAAEEVHRVLKSGGALFMSAAACAPRFVDEEHWRYTPSGIRTLLSPFAKVTIAPETSSVGGLFRTTNLWLHSFAHFPILRRCFELTGCPFLNLTGILLERVGLSRNDQFCPNYSVLAIK